MLLAAEGLEKQADPRGGWVLRRRRRRGGGTASWQSGIVALEKDAPRPGQNTHHHKSPRERSGGDDPSSGNRPGPRTWSTRTMAAAAGISEASVRRIWRAHGPEAASGEGLQAQSRSRVHRETERHRRPVSESTRTCPGALCRRKKSQIQALDRTQPGLPLKKGRCGTMTHDYKRHGTTTLFAALDALEGQGSPCATTGTAIRSG